MKRYIDESLFSIFLKDFKNVIDEIKNSKGEIDLRLRDNYINIYYKGNSLSQVDIKKDHYVVSINNKFLESVYDNDNRFNNRFISKGDYYKKINITSEEVHPFFQKKYLDKLCSNIKKIDNGEEITFEQLLITDNLSNKNMIIIDRQITETELNRKRLDLLGLRKVNNNPQHYEFVVLEVKLGKNEEIKKDVDNQIMFYIRHIESHIDSWRESYQKSFSQYNSLGIHENIDTDLISIDEKVSGILLIGGYSGIAKQYIKELETIKNHQYSIQQFENYIR